MLPSHVPLTSGLWTYQPRLHMRKATQDFSTFILLSAVRALIFLARRIQPFHSLVDREVEFFVLTIRSFSACWAFLFYALILFYFVLIFCERKFQFV